MDRQLSNVNVGADSDCLGVSWQPGASRRLLCAADSPQRALVVDLVPETVGSLRHLALIGGAGLKKV